MKALLRIGPLGAATLVALALALVALAAPGDLDPTFGANGRVILSPGIESYAAAAALQPDGKVLLAGLVDDREPPPPPPPAPYAVRIPSGDFLAVRLNADGTPDSSFGTGGAVRTPIDLVNGGYDVARAVATGPGGTIVLAGDAGTAQGSLDLAFARYTPSGTLDPSFSGDGIQTVDVGTFDSIAGVAVQSDGKVVAAGRGGAGFTVVRLRADGSLDPTFGSGGIVDTPIRDPSTRDEASAIAVLGDGRILVAGTADYSYGRPAGFRPRSLSPERRSRSELRLGRHRRDAVAKRRRRQRDGSHAERRNRRCRVRRGRAVQARALSARRSHRSKFRQCGHRHDADRHALRRRSRRVGSGGRKGDRRWDHARSLPGRVGRDGRCALQRRRLAGHLRSEWEASEPSTFWPGHDLGWALVVQPGAAARRVVSFWPDAPPTATGSRTTSRPSASSSGRSRRRRFDAVYRASSTCAWRQPGRGSRTGTAGSAASAASGHGGSGASSSGSLRAPVGVWLVARASISCSDADSNEFLPSSHLAATLIGAMLRLG